MTLYISIPYCNLQWFMRLKIYILVMIYQIANENVAITKTNILKPPL